MGGLRGLDYLPLVLSCGTVIHRLRQPPYLQRFNTEVTEMLRALRVEGLMLTEYTEPLLGDDMLIGTQGASRQEFRIEGY